MVANCIMRHLAYTPIGTLIALMQRSTVRLKGDFHNGTNEQKS